MNSAPRLAAHPAVLLLLVTLGAFVIRGVSYAMIGSWLPAAVAAFAVTIVVVTWLKAPRVLNTVKRVWAAWLIFYGLARLALSAAVNLTGIDSPHAIENTGIFFLIGSTMYLIVGIVLWRAPLPDQPPSPARHTDEGGNH